MMSKCMARQYWPGPACLGVARLGIARYGMAAVVRRVMGGLHLVWLVSAVMARPVAVGKGMSSTGEAWFGSRGLVGQVSARHGSLGELRSGQARFVGDRLGLDWTGQAVRDWYGLSRSGESWRVQARQSRHARVCYVEVSRGKAVYLPSGLVRQSGHVKARCGAVWFGPFWQSRRVESRLGDGKACQVEVRQSSLGLVSSVMLWRCTAALARLVSVRYGELCSGSRGWPGRGMLSLGDFWRGSSGKSRRGRAWRGLPCFTANKRRKL